MTALACLACVVVFLGLQFSGDKTLWVVLEKWGYYRPDALWTGKPWALLTSVFVHLEIWHIAFNLYWLWILGNILEDEIGPWKWLAFFFGAAWVSSALQLLISGDQGIGMSGVGYALFGFGWVARTKMPRFAAILNDQTVIVFVVWLVGCAIFTQLGLAHIANEAHGAGLLFGAAVAGLWVRKWKVPLSAAGLAALIGISVLPVFWCPTSPEWTGIQATNAFNRKDYATSAHWFERTIARGDNDQARWAWSNLAIIYSIQRNNEKYAEAMRELQKLDPSGAGQSEN